uniref:Uncharacterized protein n=1 Tax=Oryza punctata TaxID=4537 RepID=A0A0E0KJV6_ORYPU
MEAAVGGDGEGGGRSSSAAAQKGRRSRSTSGCSLWLWRRRSQQQQLSKSGCSSTSETSKGSDKEVTVASAPAQAASFTELLIAGVAASAAAAAGGAAIGDGADCVGIAHTGKGAEGVSTYGFSAASSFGDAPPIGMVPAPPFNFSGSGGDMAAHYSLAQDHLAAPPPPAGGDYNLNFSMSSVQFTVAFVRPPPAAAAAAPEAGWLHHFLPAWPRRRRGAPGGVRGPDHQHRRIAAMGRIPPLRHEGEEQELIDPSNTSSKGTEDIIIRLVAVTFSSKSSPWGAATSLLR